MTQQEASVTTSPSWPSVAQSTRAHHVRVLRRVLIYAFLILAAAANALPFYMMIALSLQTPPLPWPPRFIPRPASWTNYVLAWQRAEMSAFVMNSVKLVVLNVIGTICSCSLAGYAFARLKFRGRDALFAILLLTMMIPSELTMVPIFLIWRDLGQLDHHTPLWVGSWLGGAFGIFLFRQFFLTIPWELSDAAKLDGCNPFSIYSRIMIPLAKPTVATLAIFSFQWSWNEVLAPVIYLHTRLKYTLPIGVLALKGQWVSDEEVVMAAAVVMTVPAVAVFLLLQKYFVQGVVLSGIKR